MSTLTKEQQAELARKNGARWESNIRKQCFSLKNAKRALVSKNWEAPKIPGSHKKREKSKPDFSGCLPCGRHVVFEAKANFITTSLPFGQISEGQREHLSTASAWGAISFVFALDGKDRRWLIPWSELDHIEAVEDKSSFAYDEDSPFLKRRGETWLDTWERLEKGGLT